MKKYIIIGLIVLVGAALVVVPMLKDDRPTIDPVGSNSPAEFGFKENLAVNFGDETPISIEVNEPVSKLEVRFGDSIIQQWNDVNNSVSFKFPSTIFGVGTQALDLISIDKDGIEYVDNRLVRVLSDLVPEKLEAEIVKTYPHQVESFTQGLEFYNGRLFEGTGDPGNLGKTVVAEVELATGNHKHFMGLPVGFFGEGITILDGILYQLTWHNQRCYKYDVENNLESKGEFQYVGEGWGLCNDGKSLIMSDGTERIVFRDPVDFTIQRTIQVCTNKNPIANLNELEYIDGKIYANVWTTNIVVVIDPESGRVLQEIDGTELMKQGRGIGEVMNGIAQDQQTGKIYMTGKHWKSLFEVEFRNK